MIYVMSDVHGQGNAFFDMLQQINFKETDELYILGDVADRGPKVFEIYKYIIEHPNVYLLMGNHEDMMLTFRKAIGGNIKYDPKKDYPLFAVNYLNHWYCNGGMETHIQSERLEDEKLEEILNYIEAAPLFKILELNHKTYLLCHATPVFKKNYGFEDNMIRFKSDDFLWSRIKFEQNIPDGVVLIHGHTPVQYQFDSDARIIKYCQGQAYNIDCGCALKDTLGCLRLDDMKEFYERIE